MSINAYEQMATGVSDITSIALVTLEVIHNALLINELRLRFACRELLKLYSELNQLFLKALSARILMVSSKGTFLNKEDTS